jgi:hypothetical protein
MVWCVDFDCMNVTSANHSVTVLGGPSGHNQNSSHNSQDSHSNDCLCICHVPAIADVFSSSLSSLQPEGNTVIIFFSIPASPIQSIDRPPKA